LKRGKILERVCHGQRSGNFSWVPTSRLLVALCGVGGGSSQSKRHSQTTTLTVNQLSTVIVNTIEEALGSVAAH